MYIFGSTNAKADHTMPHKPSTNKINHALTKSTSYPRLKPIANHHHLESKAKQLISKKPVEKQKKATLILQPLPDRAVVTYAFETKDEFRLEVKEYNTWRNKQIAACNANIQECENALINFALQLPKENATPLERFNDDKKYADIQMKWAEALEERAYWYTTTNEYKKADEHYNKSRGVYKEVSIAFFNSLHVGDRIKNNICERQIQLNLLPKKI
jgi:hypothetical protein